MTADDDKKPWRDPAQDYGMGFLADGTYDVLTPEEYRRRVAERNAEEKVDGSAPPPADDGDDISDLGDLDDIIEKVRDL